MYYKKNVTHFKFQFFQKGLDLLSSLHSGLGALKQWPEMAPDFLFLKALVLAGLWNPIMSTHSGNTHQTDAAFAFQLANTGSWKIHEM